MSVLDRGFMEDRKYALRYCSEDVVLYEKTVTILSLLNSGPLIRVTNHSDLPYSILQMAQHYLE